MMVMQREGKKGDSAELGKSSGIAGQWLVTLAGPEDEVSVDDEGVIEEDRR